MKDPLKNTLAQNKMNPMVKGTGSDYDQINPSKENMLTFNIIQLFMIHSVIEVSILSCDVIIFTSFFSKAIIITSQYL